MELVNGLSKRVLVDPFLTQEALHLGSRALMRGERTEGDTYCVRLVGVESRDGSSSLLI
jgi:hypothetical protein